jgi:hypothetical protein
MRYLTSSLREQLLDIAIMRCVDKAGSDTFEAHVAALLGIAVHDDQSIIVNESAWCRTVLRTSAQESVWPL